MRVLLPVLALLIAPFAYVLVRWPDNFFTDDSYFYLQVAWNFAHGRGSTFNGLMHTNGYHPLWMLMCAGVYRFVQGKNAAVHAIAGLITVLNLLTLTGVTVLLRRARVTYPALSWIILVLFLFTSQLGTEGALSAMCMTLTLLTAFGVAQRPGRSLAVAYALCASLAVLSRLDNIFFVAAITAAVLVAPEQEQRRGVLRTLLTAAPIALVLWGGYLWINHRAFGIWQPISGLLKAHSRGEHRLGSNLPHIAWFDLLVIAAAVPFLRRKRNDLFFRVIEAPLTAGVLVHAMFIVFVLSSETRWTWYYTVWTLLACIVVARSAPLILGSRPHLQWPVLALCAAALLLLAVRNTYLRGRGPIWSDHGFQASVIDGAELTTLLAFDKAGRRAYYSTARIIPLDGLMGDMKFQNELASAGIAAIEQHYRVQGFIGPPQPLNAAGAQQFCGTIFLSAVRFQCARRPDGFFDVTGAEVFARLSGQPAGHIALSPSQMVWNAPNDLAVWRIEAAR